MATELKRGTTPIEHIEELLGENARTLLDHKSEGITKDQINLPGPDFIDRVWAYSDRSPGTLRSLQSLFDNGRLAGTAYLSILPVDQGIEHSAGASFAPNPQYLTRWPQPLAC
jgi:class I fructose-bisphosphate aldolase